jgi:hypothetical protein
VVFDPPFSSALGRSKTRPYHGPLSGDHTSNVFADAFREFLANCIPAAERAAMKAHLLVGWFLASVVLAHAEPESLFDGRTFAGWEGDIGRTWRIVDGAITGGSLTTPIPHNEFLATEKAYGNFDLRLKFRLLGTSGFVNAGVQFRSRRIPKHFEMIGYQADIGEGFYGCLYDESRRDKILVAADKAVIASALKLNEWNDYRVRCEGRHIQIWLNGVKTVDYTETEENIDSNGKIALQIHGGGPAEVSYKDLVIEPL